MSFLEVPEWDVPENTIVFSDIPKIEEQTHVETEKTTERDTKDRAQSRGEQSDLDIGTGRKLSKSERKKAKKRKRAEMAANALAESETTPANKDTHTPASAIAPAQGDRNDESKPKKRRKHDSGPVKLASSAVSDVLMDAYTSVPTSSIPSTSTRSTATQLSEKEKQMDAKASPALKKRFADFEKRLEGARFRCINETLYTEHSREAVKAFTEDPSLFEVYHRGFEKQVRQWPENPLDHFIRYCSKAMKKKPDTLVVDFGCGDARLARSVPNPKNVRSFDLVSTNASVVACDIANVPVETATIDIGVFCLSLMGTNWPSFVMEANRVLRNGGTLLVAEVKSRIDNRRFLEKMSKLGFKSKEVNEKNKMFTRYVFTKIRSFSRENACNPVLLRSENILKPCLYKKR